MPDHKIKKFPRTRIATIDIGAVGIKKHHVSAFLEVDLTDSRVKIRQYRRDKGKISLIAWMVKVISSTLMDYGEAASFLKGKRKLVIFNDINVSMAVEKVLDGQKVPIPLVIEKVNQRSIESITEQINTAVETVMEMGEIVLESKSNRLEGLYYHLPGFLRRMFWRYMLNNPEFAFSKMGNVSITSLGMIGKSKGWFLPISVHPICFGIGRITKKPVVVNDQIVIREILNLTVMIDHDVIDGARMARFMGELTEKLEGGEGLS